MNSFSSNRFAIILMQLYMTILSRGRVVKPAENGTINRQKEVKEILDVCFELTDPTWCLAYSEKRSFSILYAVVESMMQFSPTDKLKYFSAFNKNIGNFSDDGETLRGCYGKRINANESIQKVISMLTEDPNCRQCVIPIYSTEDLGVKSKDIPCTISLIFNIRDNKLYMSVYMRSNDAIWGLPYDVFMFTNMQQVIANTMGIGLGSYTHHSVSMHIYEHHYELAEQFIQNEAMTVKYINENSLSRQMFETSLYQRLVCGDLAIPEGTRADLFKAEIMHKAGKLSKVEIYTLFAKYPWAGLFLKRWNNGLQSEENNV